MKRIVLFSGIPLTAHEGGRTLVRPIFWRVGLLARELARKGHDVRVLAPSYEYPRGSAEVAVEGVTIRHIGFANLPYSPAVHSRPSYTAYFWAIAQSLKRTASLVSAFEPDIIHLFTPFPYSIATGLFLKTRGYRLCIDIDDAIHGQMQKNHYAAALVAAQRVCDYRVPRLFDGVTVCSGFLAAALGEKARCLPNMVGREFFIERKQEEERPVSVVMVGSIDGIQGHEAVIRRVIPRVFETCPDVEWTFVGEGRHLGQMKRLAVELIPRGKIFFTGYLGHQDILGRLSRADIGLLPLEDAVVNRARCPLKLLEYQAAGLAVVASTLGEAKRLVQDKVSGCLVGQEDWEGFADALIFLALNRKAREEMGQNARKQCERFEASRMAGEWLAYWDTVYERH